MSPPPKIQLMMSRNRRLSDTFSTALTIIALVAEDKAAEDKSAEKVDDKGASAQKFLGKASRETKRYPCGSDSGVPTRNLPGTGNNGSGSRCFFTGSRRVALLSKFLLKSIR
jgi:hypothetical protein